MCTHVRTQYAHVILICAYKIQKHEWTLAEVLFVSFLIRLSAAFTVLASPPPAPAFSSSLECWQISCVVDDGLVHAAETDNSTSGHPRSLFPGALSSADILPGYWRVFPLLKHCVRQWAVNRHFNVAIKDHCCKFLGTLVCFVLCRRNKGHNISFAVLLMACEFSSCGHKKQILKKALISQKIFVCLRWESCKEYAK